MNTEQQALAFTYNFYTLELTRQRVHKGTSQSPIP